MKDYDPAEKGDVRSRKGFLLEGIEKERERGGEEKGKGKGKEKKKEKGRGESLQEWHPEASVGWIHMWGILFHMCDMKSEIPGILMKNMRLQISELLNL